MAYRNVVAVGAAAIVVGAVAVAVASTGAGRLAPQHRARPSVAELVRLAGCSNHAPSRVSPDAWSLTRVELAPPGASAIGLCRYSGLNDHPRLTLIRAAAVTAPSLVGRLVGEFDRLPASEGAVACPDDNGSEIIARLVYPNRHLVTISVGLTGCERVTNGSVNRTAAGIGAPPAFGPELLTQLKRLTPASPLLPAEPRPPTPRISTLGVTRLASPFSYCWEQALAGGKGAGVCADGAPGAPAHSLRWRPGAPVSIDLRLAAHNVQIEVARIGGFAQRMHDVVHLNARRVDQAGRLWVIRLPQRAIQDTDLLISALFANGDLSADIGLRQQYP